MVQNVSAVNTVCEMCRDSHIGFKSLMKKLSLNEGCSSLEIIWGFELKQAEKHHDAGCYTDLAWIMFVLFSFWVIYCPGFAI